MIDDPRPADWKQLQAGVCRLFSEVGLAAETEREVPTPRGRVKIDVYAVDENSVDRIRYLVECKNWASRVPQHVVHAFTTVMHETGGNIGFIISKEGFQSGALEYIQHTNIVGLNYLELQQRYFEQWWSKFFAPFLGASVDALLQYVEPINSRRERFFRALSIDKQKTVKQLQEKYERFGMTIAFVGFAPSAKRLAFEPPSAVSDFKRQLVDAGLEETFSSVYFRDLAFEIGARAQSIANEFHGAFGENIFAS